MKPILAATCLLLACGPAAAQTLTGADIQQQLSGKRVSLSCVDGTTGTGQYTMAKNFGIIAGNYRKTGEASASDRGQVRAAGSQLCLTFQRLNEGEELCVGVVQRAPGKFQFTKAFIRVCDVTVI